MRLSSTCLITALLSAATHPVGAQGRRALDTDDPQAHLMGFYAAAMLMTPVGAAPRGLDVGAEFTVLPALSDDERRVGFGGTKLEKTNFCPVLPRLRGGVGVGAGGLEVGVVPPLEVCGVRALLVSAAYQHRIPLAPGWALGVRGNLLAGRLEASITCSEEAVADPNDPTCAGGTPSEDRVRPFTLGADLLLIHDGDHHARLAVYALAGARRERVGFDVNYVRAAGNPANRPALVDHERLQATLTRAHVAAGAAYRLWARLTLGGEVYYAPGALLTVRGRASVPLRVMP